jgi:branched-chain amino acid transport system substrate-binding protein
LRLTPANPPGAISHSVDNERVSQLARSNFRLIGCRLNAAHQPQSLPLQLLDRLPANPEVRIGVPIDAAAHGPELIVGAYLAIAHHHQSGGFPVAARWHDDGRNAEGGRAAAEQLVGSGIRYVVGHFSSRAALAAAPVYAENDALFVAPGSSSPELTALSNRGTALRLFGRDDEQAAAIVEVLQQVETQGDVEVFAEDNGYGRSVSSTIATLLECAGVPARVAVVRNFETLVSDATGPVILAGTHEFSARLLCRLSPARCRIVTDDAFTPAFLGATGTAADGALVAIIRFDARSDEFRRLSSEAAGLLGNGPGAYFLTSYVATELILKALRTLGDCGGRCIAGHLRSLRWRTLLGSLVFEPSGEVQGLSWGFARVERGQFVLP